MKEKCEQKIFMTLNHTCDSNHITLHKGKQGARPAEIGALAPVFEKSAAELKTKPKLL